MLKVLGMFGNSVNTCKTKQYSIIMVLFMDTLYILRTMAIIIVYDVM